MPRETLLFPPLRGGKFIVHSSQFIVKKTLPPGGRGKPTTDFPALRAGAVIFFMVKVNYELLCSDPCQVEKTGNYENIF
jgi:hypothetical protein